MKNNSLLTIFSILVFAGIFFYCLYKVITALKRGYITYAGNSSNLYKARRYSRKEQPFLFWAGIFAFSLPVLIMLGLLLAFADWI
jgi:hypothetical protein